MWKYIVKRILIMIPVLLGVIFLIMFLLDLAPGDPALMVVGDMATEEEIEEAREELGLNDSLIVRYVKYVVNLCKGDLGSSYLNGESVLGKFKEKFPATVVLAIAASCISISLSIPLGIFSAVNQNSWKDSGSMVLALIGVSMPNFWLGLLLMFAFALHLGWFPSFGFNGFGSIVLPAVTEGISLMGLLTRSTRSAMLETLRADYMTTALAKGVSRKGAIIKHAFRNALIPVVTVGGMGVVSILAGTVMTERVFSWPGIGLQLLTAINNRDQPMVTGFLIMISIIVCVSQLILDIIYAFIDPRIKAQYTKGRK